MRSRPLERMPSGGVGGRGILWTAGRLLRLTGGRRWLLPLLVALGLLSFLMEGAAVYLLMPLMSQLVGTPPTSGVAQRVVAAVDSLAPASGTGVLILLIVGCLALKGLIQFCSQAGFSLVNARIGDELRRTCFTRILGAGPGFQDRQGPGTLLNTLATETWRLSQGLQSFAWMILHLCAVVVFLTLMVLISPTLTLVVGLGAATILVLVQLVAAQGRRYGLEAVRANQRLAGRITEGLAGLRTIWLLGREDFEAARFARASGDVRRAFVRMDVLNSVPGTLLQILFAVLLGLLIYVGGELVSVIVFIALLQRMQPHLASLSQARVSLSMLTGALEAVDVILEAPAIRGVSAGSRPAGPMAVGIALNDVTLVYPGSSEPVLRRVSLTVPARRTTALVGHSGAGKSSVLSLVVRLVDPSEGSVTVDGTDLRDLDLDAWRRRCAVVPQDVFLFDATVRENIAYGWPEATDEQVRAAARAAQAHDFIAALPEGYETRMGDRGAMFSGGQRQRIALARALVRDAEVLILDEATNALDTQSERLVRDALAQVSGQRTVIVIAHRLESVEQADHVIVLRHGQVVETGRPSELFARGGPFAEQFGQGRLSA